MSWVDKRSPFYVFDFISRRAYEADTLKFWETEDRALTTLLDQAGVSSVDGDGVGVGGPLRVEQLVAERDRYRKALEEILERTKQGPSDYGSRSRVWHTARRALDADASSQEDRS